MSQPSPRQALTEGPVGSQLIRLTLPMIWGIFAVMAIELADAYFVGQLGTPELAAMSFTFPVTMVLSNLAIGLGVGASSVIARAIGEGNPQRVQRLTTNSLFLSLLIVVVCVLFGFLTLDPLFAALGAEPDILPLIQEYMHIWYLGMVFLVVPMVGNTAIRAAGNSEIPSLIMTLAAITNIGLNPLLIFGLGGFPRLELQGAALATVAARALSLVLALLFLHFRQRMLSLFLPTWEDVRGCWSRILHVGLPAAGTNMVIPISAGIITSLMAGFGPEAVAGFGVASRLELLSLSALAALSTSVAPFIGQNWGAKRYQRVQESLRLSFFFCLGWGALMTVLLGLGSTTIAAQFESNPEVTEVTASYLRIVPLSYAGTGLLLTVSAAFNALGKPLAAVILSLTRMFLVYIPLAYVGSQLIGVNGIFLAACIANWGVGLAAVWWSRRSEQFRPPILVKQPLSG
ncbi:MAG: MATE family efflux transporter [Thermostichus sp. DG02_5_bins_236]